jgi:hypothetical protein
MMSTSSEKFCLKWNDFRANVHSAFAQLREDRDFTDVTLACEDGHQVEAHKVILAASSPFFQNILRKNNHPHPLIYMRGIKSEDLVATVDFLYYGQVSIYQENLDGFLAIAKELNLKGLAGEGSVEKPKEHVRNPKPFPKEDQTEREHTTLYEYQEDQNYVMENDQEGAIVAAEYTVSTELKELDDKVKSMMTISEVNRLTNGNKARTCTVCGKEGQWVTIRDHIEADHITGVSLFCHICQKSSSTRASLRKHKCTRAAPSYISHSRVKS